MPPILKNYNCMYNKCSPRVASRIVMVVSREAGVRCPGQEDKDGLFLGISHGVLSRRADGYLAPAFGDH